MNKYKIEITLPNGPSYQIELTTDRLEWTMDQYQRNRQPLNWKIIKKEAI